MTGRLSLPTKPCHTCRRKRLRCDRSLPQCRKCISSGQECLGYGPLLRWNKGVASRGKMMGRTFDGQDGTPEASSSAATCSVPSEESHVPQARALISQLPLEASNIPRSFHDDETILANHTELFLRPSLNDPVIQDLAYNDRRYVFHFANFLCSDYMLYDLGPRNPLLNLIPMASSHPILMQVIVANSAQHLFHLCRHSAVWIPSKNLRQLSNQINFTEAHKSVNLLMSTSYKDSLIAKQNSLKMLREELQDMETADPDIVLASVMLLVFFELIGSGKHTWRVHLNGARSVVAALELGWKTRTPKTFDRVSTRICLLSEYLVFSILGSTLRYSLPPSFLDLPVDLDLVLKYAETYNYLSFPADILKILLRAAEIARDAQPHIKSTNDEGHKLFSADYYQRVSDLFQTAQSFNPTEWANRLQGVSPFHDAEHRAHVASAHQSAVCLYIFRVLPGTSDLLDPASPHHIQLDIPSLITSIMHHLSFITSDDALLKSTCWPTFIAGAESTDPAHRAWIAQRMQLLWASLQWGYIKSSLEVLNDIWEKMAVASAGVAEVGGQEVGGQVHSTNWIEEVARPDTDLFFA